METDPVKDPTWNSSIDGVTIQEWIIYDPQGRRVWRLRNLLLLRKPWYWGAKVIARGGFGCDVSPV